MPHFRVANSDRTSPRTKPRLMRPFQQLTPDRTAAHDGHGLSLAACEMVVINEWPWR
jgi:hypothetical protein